MNGQHLRAFVWLRWRLLVNQWSRGGTLNTVLMIALCIAAVVTVIPLLIGSFWLGLFMIPRAQPVHLMVAWDVLVLGFLFFWSIGLLAELQRSESLSLSKFLHLPVSAGGAFLLNYLSSLPALSLLLFGPVMLGFGLALVYVKGPLMLPVLPSLAAFFLMITALTYQFQGWLAILMANPRRRRTVIVTATALFILIAQLPSLIDFLAPWKTRGQAESARALAEELKKLEAAANSPGVDPAEFLRLREESIARFKQNARARANRETLQYVERTGRVVNLVLPIGWLPLGVLTAAEGSIAPSLLGFLGMGMIGAASLWRSYRATVGQYQGQSAGRKRPAAAERPRPEKDKPAGLMLEARLPGLSEPVSAVALANLRALARAPEAKMMLLTPIIAGPIFGSMLWRQRQTLPEAARPWVAAGGMVFVLLGMAQMMGNLFGLDRDGFRVFVLSAVPRRDILMGKNLAFAPVALCLAGIVLAIVQAICPMRLDHVLASIPQAVSMFLLFCLCMNLMSIYAPMHIAAGSLKPSNPKATTVILQLAVTLVLIPLTQAVTLLPLGAELMLSFVGIARTIPVCLLLSFVECALILLVYRIFLNLQARDLRAREQRILEIVTSRAP